MQFLKSLARGLLALVFKFSLVFLVVIGPLVMVFGTSAQLKRSLSSSKIYDQGASSIIDGIGKEDSGQPPGNQEDSPFDQPVVKDAAKAALTPAFLQSTSEQIIDGIYGWLQGKTPEPRFNIDVSGVKQQFTAAVGDQAVSRAKQLPACTLAQTRELANQKIDPLQMPCVPTGFDINTLPALVSEQLNKPDTESDEKNLLQQTAITPDSLPKNDEGKTPVQNFTEQASKLPQIFHLLTLAPVILGILAVVSGGLLVLLYDEKRRGFRHIAITLMVIGVVSLAGIFVTNAVFNKLEKSDALVKADANLKEPMVALVHSLSDAFNSKLLLYGIAYAVLGAGTLVALRLTKPDQTTDHGSTIHHPETSDLSSEASVKREEPAVEKTDEKPDEPEDKPKKSDKKLIQ